MFSRNRTVPRNGPSAAGRTSNAYGRAFGKWLPKTVSWIRSDCKKICHEIDLQWYDMPYGGHVHYNTTRNASNTGQSGVANVRDRAGSGRTPKPPTISRERGKNGRICVGFQRSPFQLGQKHAMIEGDISTFLLVSRSRK